jgi:ribosomal protein L23
MKIKPLMTEKSLSDAKDGSYTFLVERGLTKEQIKRVVEGAFGVHVVSVRTANIKSGSKKNARGQIQKVKAVKKAWVNLKEKEKIDIFESELKGK